MGVEATSSAGRKASAEWFTAGRFALLLAAMFLASFPEVILGEATFVHRDYGRYSYPVMFHGQQSFWRGEVPFWNPLSYCGAPFLAQWSTLVLYPPGLFNQFLPLTWALPVFSFAHLWLGGLGAFFLARRWTGHALAGAVAGVVFAFNGLSLNCLMWPHYCVAIGWMPWVVLAAERGWREGGRATLIAVLVGTMQMLSGTPEVILLTWVFVAALAAGVMVRGSVPRKKMLLRLAVQVAWVTVLCAAQLLPFLELIWWSQRDSTFGGSLNWSMPGWGLANFLVPLFYEFRSKVGVYHQPDQYFTSSYYVGIGCVWLWLLAFGGEGRRRVWLLLAALLGSVVLAMGEDGYVFPWLLQAMPALGVARYTVKFLFLAMLAAALLAAFGLARSEPANGGKEVRLAWRHWGTMGVLLFLIGVLLVFARAYPLPQTEWSVTLWSGLSRGGFLVLIAGAVWLLPHVRTGRNGWLLRLGLVTFVWLDLITHAPSQNPTVEVWTYHRDMVQEKEQFDPFPAHGTARAMIRPETDIELHFRIVRDPQDDFLVSRYTLFSNCNLLDGIAKVNGFYSLVVRHSHELTSGLYRTTNSADGLLDFLGVSHTTPPEYSLEWTNRPGFLPLVTAGQRPAFVEPAEGFRALFQAEFEPATVVYLPTDVKDVVAGHGGAEASVQSLELSARRVRAEIAAASPTLAVIAQTWYPGWEARVNGQPAPVLRANHAFQAVPVPAGKSELELAYRARRAEWGGLVSFLGLAVWLAVWRCGRARPEPVRLE
jgi:hypothetical protein